MLGMLMKIKLLVYFDTLKVIFPQILDGHHFPNFTVALTLLKLVNRPTISNIAMSWSLIAIKY